MALAKARARERAGKVKAAAVVEARAARAATGAISPITSRRTARSSRIGKLPRTQSGRRRANLRSWRALGRRIRWMRITRWFRRAA